MRSYLSTNRSLMKTLKARGVSRYQAAKTSNLSRQTIRRMCAKDRSGNIDSWIRLADALDCSLDDLARLEEESDDEQCQ